jgi:hypothetical protein
MDKDSSRKPVNLRIAKSADDNGSQGDSKKAKAQNAIGDNSRGNKQDREKKDRRSSTTHDGEGSEMF